MVWRLSFPGCFELYGGSQSFQCGVTRSGRVDEDIEVEDPKRRGVLAIYWAGCYLSGVAF
jgi:hypothetical protein